MVFLLLSTMSMYDMVLSIGTVRSLCLPTAEERQRSDLSVFHAMIGRQPYLCQVIRGGTNEQRGETHCHLRSDGTPGIASRGTAARADLRPPHQARHSPIP